jgi:mannose/fructose/N-acetylgalactosamine-specific phosphotransferase system component IID
LVFVGVGFVLSLLAITAGTFWVAVIFVLEVVWTCVTYATTAFFYAAGVRLYQDLNAMMRERIAPAAEMVLPATAPLSDKIRA